MDHESRRLPGLGPLHSFFLRLGRVRGVLLISLVSIGASVLFTLIALYKDGWIVNSHVRNWSLTIAVVIPAIVGTTVGLITMNMLFRLRDAIARIAELASTDALTGLQNRRSFADQAEPLLALARGRGVSVSLVLLDLDHFKQINDQHGHLVGDAVLVQAAQVCRESLRATDLAARYGGEEYVVLLPDCGSDAAAAIAENLRKRIEAARTVLSDGGEVRVTLSAGIATADRLEDLSLAYLLQRADAAMYRAKQSGRNRVHADRAIAVVA